MSFGSEVLSFQHTGAMNPLIAPLGVALAAGGACCVVWVCNPMVPGGPLPVCPTRALLGIDCPGCGSMRMLYSLMHGDVIAALHFNAAAVLALPLLLWAYVSWVRERVTGKTVTSWQHKRWAPIIALAVVCIWFVIRNVPITPFTVLHV